MNHPILKSCTSFANSQNFNPPLMQLFRKLAGNIFFKIILAFVALSFVLFGVSGFILGNPNSWVVKIGSTTIGINAFNKAIQSDREMILASNKSEEALKYLDSERFKSDVLGRLVNKSMIEKLHDNFGVEASKKLILEAVAKDPSFKSPDGKFDREIFKKFLTKNGLNEEKYVNEIANDIVATMIIQTMSMAAPLDYNSILEIENFKQEKRLADVITISIKNIGNISASNDEIAKFFETNKQKYSSPELRKISYLHFSKKDFVKDLQISDAEILAEYEKNKEQFNRPESRNFYHLLFDEEPAAKDFLTKFSEALGSDKSRAKDQFIKLAKELQKKDVRAITLTQISKKDLLPQIADQVFQLNISDHSDVLKSPLGFHIFLLNEIKQPQAIPFAEVKNGIRQKMSEGREEKVLQTKISEIDDALLTSNSLAEVAKKFNLKASSSPVKIDHIGQNEKGEQVAEIKGFEDFAQNAFALKKDQVSKIFYAKISEGFYALKVEEIEASHEKDLAQVKSQVTKDLLENKKHEALKNLALKVGEEIKTNPSSINEIVTKYRLKLEKNREFPRVFYINYQGRQMPYQNKFLDELFALKINQVTPVLAGGAEEFVVGILREIKKSSASGIQFEQAKKQADENFKTEILQEYNQFLLKKNPVKVNEKILGKKEEK